MLLALLHPWFARANRRSGREHRPWLLERLEDRAVPAIAYAVGPGGGPHVKVFSGADNSTLASFMAYSIAFAGGVSVGASDMGGDNGGTAGGRNGLAEIVTGAGPGGGPHVKVFDTHTTPGVAEEIASFMAYNTAYSGGVNVASGFVTNNLDTDGFIYADIVTGPG